MPFVTCIINLFHNTVTARKAETEKPGSSMPEVRAKSAVVGTDSKPEVARSDPPYEVITQLIAYLMSAITNQNVNKNNGQNGSKQNNRNGKFSNMKSQRPMKDRKDMKCWGCGCTGHSWKECFRPMQGNDLPFRLANQNLNG